MSPKVWNAPAAATDRAATVCVSWLPALIPSPLTRPASPKPKPPASPSPSAELADLPITLTVAGGKEVVEVNAQAEIVETSRSSTTDTIGERRIDNLPINGRNYIQFTLTDSQVQRDSAPQLGAAPTSGLNMSGQRARSNLVNVDGADATDNSTNGVRSTVSQEDGAGIPDHHQQLRRRIRPRRRRRGQHHHPLRIERVPRRCLRISAQSRFPGRQPLQHHVQSCLHPRAGGRSLRWADQERQDVLFLFL